MGFLSRVKRALSDVKDLLPGPVEDLAEFAVSPAAYAANKVLDAAVPDVPSVADVQPQVDAITQTAEEAGAEKLQVGKASEENRRRRFAALSGRAFRPGSLAVGNSSGLNG